MNVLYINTFDIAGGAEQICFELFNSHKPSAMLVKNKFSDKIDVQPFPIYTRDKVFFSIDQVLFRYGVKNRLKSKLFIADQLNQTYKKLSSLEVYKNADIVHLHNIHGGYFDLSSLEQIAKDKKIVWTLHDMWALTGGESYTFENDNFKRGIGKTPFIDVQPLNMPLIDRRQAFIEKKKRLYEMLGNRLTFVAISEWMERNIRESYVYNNNVNISRIDNGYDDTIFFNRHLDKGKKPKILFFNSSQLYKGSKVFTSIINDFVNLADITNIGKPVSIEGVKDVPFTTNRKQIADHYNQHDIFILPSLAESFSLVALEAMACGMCVIASNAGALPERIAPATGYLFSVSDSEDLKTKINIALSDLEKTREIGYVASNHVRGLSVIKMVEKYESLYRSLLA
jgi:glycosyltransferase involved in cell wall biosynthesis